jgi:hypothetical protein
MSISIMSHQMARLSSYSLPAFYLPSMMSIASCPILDNPTKRKANMRENCLKNMICTKWLVFFLAWLTVALVSDAVEEK